MNASLPPLLKVPVVAVLAVVWVVVAVLTDAAVVVPFAAVVALPVLPFYYCYMIVLLHD